VTRNADTITLVSSAFTDVYASAAAYTMFIEYIPKMAIDQGTAQALVNVNDGLNERVGISRRGSDGNMDIRHVDGGTAQVSTSHSSTAARNAVSFAAVSSEVATGGLRASANGSVRT
jgi:hypothetical protein